MSSIEDIPKPLIKLVRLIMSGFYNVEQKLVIDMLVRRRETKEDDLVEYLKFEKKYLRSLIQQLKQDKFINVRLIMETGEDGKSTRHNYYSVNYRMFVNVVKFRIDHMRRKLETEERDLTSRSCYVCQDHKCRKKFTDLEAGEIYDMTRGQFFCSHCGGIVAEDPNVRPKTNSRFVMANFNEQMQPIYTSLQETENIKWSIIEADRNNLNANANNSSAAANSTNDGSKVGVGDLPIAKNFGPNSINEPLIRIIPSVKLDSINEIHKKQNSLLNDFFKLAFIDEKTNDKVNTNVEKKILQDQKSEISNNSSIHPEVEALLLREECQSSNNSIHQNSSLHNSMSNSRYKFMNDSYQNLNGSYQSNKPIENNSGIEDEFYDDEDDMAEASLMVSVGSTKFPINKISDEQVQLMTPFQRKDYERLTRYIHSQVYD